MKDKKKDPSEGRLVKLIEDLPADRDAFGSHSKVAEAIRQLVVRESGGKAIALIGHWGSGKSTVVNLLLKSSQADGGEGQNLKVFLFDAWAHEGDPLRRTFLEQLIERLCKVGWLDEKKWKDRLDELSNRRRVSKVKSLPQPTKLGFWFGVSVFLIPLGFSLLGRVDGLALNLLAYGLAVSPLVVLLGAYTFKKAWRMTDKEKAALLSFLVNRKVEITTTDTIETPNPTSVEFQRCFCQISEEALVGQRKLLIVLDNLDRVQRAESLRIWSAMRTFLEVLQNEQNTWGQCLWILVPFDVTGISRLWEDESVADTFLDKTFQIRFEVPIPVLSDWRFFLRQMLQEAFPGQKTEDYYRISRIYDVLRPEGQPLTPRALKLFVNQIGAVHRRAVEDFPIVDEALYVATRLYNPTWKPGSALTDKEPRLQPHLSGDWRLNLASLYYNVPRERALQVLFGSQVEKVLTEGNDKELVDLMKNEGIEYVVERILEQRLEEWTQNEPHTLGRVAYTFDAANVPSAQEWNDAWRRLQTKVGQVSKWPFLDSKSGVGIGALIRRAQDPNFSKGILASLVEVPSTADENKSKLSQWADGLLEILHALESAGQKEILEASNQGSGFGTSVQTYLQLLDTIFDKWNKVDLWHYISPRVRPDEVAVALADAVGNATFDVKSERACSVMQEVNKNWEWGRILSAIQSRFKQPLGSIGEFGPVFRTVHRLRQKEERASELLEDQIASGWAYHHFQSAFAANHFDSTAVCMMPILLLDPDAAKGANPAQASVGRNTFRSVASNPSGHQAIVQALAATVLDLDYLEDLLAARGKSPTSGPTIDSVLALVAKGNEAFRDFTPALICKHWSELRSALEEKILDELVESSASKGKLVSFVNSATFTIELAGLYRRLLKLKQQEGIRELVSSGLNRLQSDEWRKSVSAEDGLVELIKQMQELGNIINAGPALEDALRGIADSTLGGSKVISGEKFDVLYDALRAQQKTLLARHIRDELIMADSSVETLFEVCGKALSLCQVLEEEADRLVREGFRKIMDRMQEREFASLADLAEQCPGITKVRPETLEALRYKIGEIRAKVPSESIKSSINRLATSFALGQSKEDAEP